jgi:hypothetical protein
MSERPEISPLDFLPEGLRRRAYRADSEAARPGVEGIELIERLTTEAAAVEGIEIWLPTTPAPTIPMPSIYVWTAQLRGRDEAWADFTRRANAAAAEYIRGFAWD